MLDEARALFREYASSLAIDLSFPGFAQELAGLPGEYAAPHGTLLLGVVGGVAAGCVAVRRWEDRVCEMKRLDVRDSFKGQGRGRVLAFPLSTRTPRGPHAAQRAVRHPEVTRWFTRPGGEGQTFDLFPALPRVQCPTLVLGGEDDPMTPIECQADIAAALPPHLVRFERIPDCRHAVIPDAPERGMALIREFIAG